MPAGYFADRGVGRNVPYERYRDSTSFRATKYTNDEDRSASVNRRLYQPPVAPIPGPPENHSHGYRNDNSTSRQRDYLTNDDEFFKMASTILSSLPDNEQSGTETRGESVGIAKILQKILSVEEMKQFSDALHTRFQCLPRMPSSNDNQLIYIVRRCERVFGREIRTLAHAMASSPQRESEEMPRQSSQGQGWRSQSGKVSFSSPVSDHEVRDEYSKVLHPTHFNVEGGKLQEEASNHDLTDHIIWDESGDRYSPVKNDIKLPTGGTVLTQQETASSASSDFTGSMIYDMIIDSKEKNTKEVRPSCMKRDSTRINDNDEASIASSYSAARSKATSGTGKSNRRFVKVLAPATLPENTMFEARLGDEIFMVHVPRGGVKKGQIFESNMLDMNSTSSLDPAGRVKRFVNMGSPMMRWRDRLFDCFANGVFHPMLLTSFCCTSVALAQVMSRMQLDVFGNKATHLMSRINVDIVRLIPLVLLFLHGILAFLMYRAFHLHVKGMKWVFAYSSVIVLAIDLVIYVNMMRMTIKIRRFIRQEYNIPGTRCGDVMASVLCNPCAIAQMGRHTADYDTYIGVCCTKTGLPDQIEVKLPNDDTSESTVGVQV